MKRCNTNQQMTPLEYLTERWLSFWMNVDIPDNPDACWMWTGFITPSGHGQFFYGKRDTRASRAAWIMFHGPIKSSDYICHKCNNPSCVRLDHLYKGTHRSNQSDKVGIYCNEKATYVKLDWNKVYQIRAMQGLLNQSETARNFGISPTTVRRVWNQESRGGWREEVRIDGELSAHD